MGILRLTTADTIDPTPLSDQITRVEYGVQFSAMEAVRFPQLNFNLNLILDIPQVVMPTEQKEEQCDEADPTCRSYNLCDKLLGIHQTTSKPHRQQDTDGITHHNTGADMLCNLMAYTLERIEETQTALSFSLATILKDSLDIFDLSESWEGVTGVLSDQPNLADTPEALWDKLEETVEKSFAESRMKADRDRSKLANWKPQTHLYLHDYKNNLDRIMDTPLEDILESYLWKLLNMHSNHSEVGQNIIAILNFRNKKTNRPWGLRAQGFLTGYMRDKHPGEHWLAQPLQYYLTDDVRKGRTKRSVYNWDALKREGKVDADYERRYFQTLGQFIQGQAPLIDLMNPQQQDPYQVRKFRPYAYEMELKGWPPEYVSQVEDRTRSVIRRINNKADNKYNTFKKLQARYVELKTEHSRYCFGEESAQHVSPYYRDFVCHNMMLLADKFINVTAGMRQWYKDRIDGLMLMSPSSTREKRSPRPETNSTANITTAEQSQQDRWEDVTSPNPNLEFMSDTNTTNIDNTTSPDETNYSHHFSSWKEYFQNKSRHDPKYYEYLISEYESDMNMMNIHAKALMYNLQNFEDGKLKVQELLSELEDPVDRNKRWAITTPFLAPITKGIGQVAADIFGFATKGQIQNLQDVQQDLYKNQLKLRTNIMHFRQEYAANLALTAAHLSHLGSMVNLMNDKINEVAARLASRINLNLKFSSWGLSTLATVVQDITAMRTQLDKFITALRHLREHRLSPELISEPGLKKALEDIAEKLRRNLPLYRILHEDISWYYQYSRPTYMRHGDKLVVSLFIPLSSNRELYYLYKVESFEVPAPGQPDLYTYLINPVEVFGTNEDGSNFLELKLVDVEKCKQYSTVHCRRATKVYSQRYPTCLTALFNNDTLKIKELCNYQLESTPLRPNLIPSGDNMIVVATETITKQCMTDEGNFIQDVETGCSVCIKPRHCNCIYVATSKLGSVSVPADMEHCSTFTLDRHVEVPLNMAKLQYMWSDDYLENVSAISAEEITKMSDAEFIIDDTKFEHALNRHYEFSISLGKAAQKAKENVPIYPIKMLPQSTWDLEKWEDFFTLENSLTVTALGVSTAAMLAVVYAIKSVHRVRQMLALMAIAARPVHAKTIESEGSLLEQIQALTTLEKYFYGVLILSVFWHVLIAVLWLIYKICKNRPRTEFATLELVLKSGASQVRILVMKVTCSPMSLIQEADQAVAIVKTEGPTRKMTLHLNWGNRVYRQVATDVLVNPKSVIKLSSTQGDVTGWILKHPHLVHTELTYHDKRGNSIKAPASLHDLPRGTVCFNQNRLDLPPSTLPNISERWTGKVHNV